MSVDGLCGVFIPGWVRAGKWQSQQEVVWPYALLPLLFNSALDYAIMRAQVNQESLKLSGTNQLLVYADDVNTLEGSVHTIKKNGEALIVASKEIELEVTADKTKN